jgi:hypothetical protein
MGDRQPSSDSGGCIQLAAMALAIVNAEGIYFVTLGYHLVQ